MKFLIYVVYFFCFYAHSSADTPYYYVFGDGTSDTGNTIAALSSTFNFPPNRSPYGEEYTLGPNGRWSNGQLWIDDYDYLKYEVLSYLVNTFPEYGAIGVNFAFAGSTALDNSTLNKHNILTAGIPSLQDQLKNFMEVLSRFCSPSVDSSCSYVYYPKVFVGPIGMMDIMYAYTQRKNYTEIMNLIPSIVNNTIQVITDFAELGMRYIYVFLNFTLGCFPSIINHCNYNTTLDENGCVELVNNVTFYQNQLLIYGLQNLSKSYIHTTIATVDGYNLLLNITKDPSSFGFNPNTTLKPCCGDGLFKFTDQFCGGANATVCGDPNNYIHWDGINLTREVHKKVNDLFSNVILNPTIGGPGW